MMVDKTNQWQECGADEGQLPVVADGHDEADDHGAGALQDQPDPETSRPLDFSRVATQTGTKSSHCVALLVVEADFLKT